MRKKIVDLTEYNRNKKRRQTLRNPIDPVPATIEAKVHGINIKPIDDIGYQTVLAGIPSKNGYDPSADHQLYAFFNGVKQAMAESGYQIAPAYRSRTAEMEYVSSRKRA